MHSNTPFLARRALQAFVACTSLLLIVVGCYGSDVTNPPTGPGTPYPCGVWGVTCPHAMCCPQDHVCGFDGPGSRCPAGYCCYDGEHWPAMKMANDAGADDAATMTKQRPAP